MKPPQVPVRSLGHSRAPCTEYLRLKESGRARHPGRRLRFRVSRDDRITQPLLGHFAGQQQLLRRQRRDVRLRMALPDRRYRPRRLLSLHRHQPGRQFDELDGCQYRWLEAGPAPDRTRGRPHRGRSAVYGDGAARDHACADHSRVGLGLPPRSDKSHLRRRTENARARADAPGVDRLRALARGADLAMLSATRRIGQHQITEVARRSQAPGAAMSRPGPAWARRATAFWGNGSASRSILSPIGSTVRADAMSSMGSSRNWNCSCSAHPPAPDAGLSGPSDHCCPDRALTRRSGYQRYAGRPDSGLRVFAVFCGRGYSFGPPCRSDEPPQPAGIRYRCLEHDDRLLRSGLEFSGVVRRTPGRRCGEGVLARSCVRREVLRHSAGSAETEHT